MGNCQVQGKKLKLLPASLKRAIVGRPADLEWTFLDKCKRKTLGAVSSRMCKDRSSKV
jgi:hypothetical protein